MKDISRAALLLALITGLLVGCGAEDDPPTYHEQVEAKHPVDLPARPNLDSILKAPRQYGDGALSVTGLILDRNANLGKEVTIRGRVRFASEDCPFLTDPKEIENRPVGDANDPAVKEKLRSCTTPHITIADKQHSPMEMLIINYDPYFHPYFIKGIEEGMVITVKGMYDFTDGRFHRPRDGLIIASEGGVTSHYVDYVGNFYSRRCKLDEECNTTDPEGEVVEGECLIGVGAEEPELATEGWCKPELYEKPPER